MNSGRNVSARNAQWMRMLGAIMGIVMMVGVVTAQGVAWADTDADDDQGQATAGGTSLAIGTVAAQGDNGSYQIAVNVSNASNVPSGNYYALLSLSKDGVQRYYLQQLDMTQNGTFTVTGPFVEQYNPGSTCYIEDAEPSVTLLKASGELQLADAASRQNCSEIPNDALCGDNFVSISPEPGTATIALNKFTGTPTDYKVTLSFVDKHGSRTKLTSLEDDPITGSSAVLVCLSKKGSSEIVAWALKQFGATELNDDAYWEGTFDSFMVCDASGKATEGTVKYNPEDFDATVRYYHHESEWTQFDARVGVTYSDAVASATDWVPGYSFSENVANGNSQRDLYQYKAFANTYKLNVDYSPVGMQAGDSSYYVLLEVPHETTGKAYFLQKLDPSAESQAFTVINAEGTTNNWMNADGSSRNNERFSSEETVNVYVLSSPNANLSVSDAANKNNCTYYAEGMPFSPDLYAFKKGSRSTVENEATRQNVVTDSIHLKKLEVSDDYDFLSILGPGAYYGITADTFNQQNHAQTNFAVNHYNGNGNGVDPDLAGNSGVVVAAEGTQDAGGKIIKFGESHAGNVLFYVGNGDANCLVNPRDWVYVVPSTYEKLSTEIVEPIIEHGDRISRELLAHEATIGVSPADDNKIYIDTLDFPDNVSIYIDGDSVSGYLAQGKLNITKKENQLIVFNFDSTETLSIGEFCVRYSRDGDYTKTDTPTTKGEKNTWLDNLARHIVWNCASVKSLDLGITTGIFLLPDAESGTVVSGTSSGWIISDGSVRNPSGEWHFNYGGLADIQTANLSIGKTVDGKVPTASQIFEFSFDHLVTSGEGAPYWSGLKNYVGDGDNQIEVPWTNHNGEIQIDNITQMEDGWNIYRVRETRVGEHAAGSYTLDSRAVFAVVEYKLLTSNGASDVHQQLKVVGVPTYYVECNEDETPDITFGEGTFTNSAESLDGAFGTGGSVKLKKVTEPVFENATEGKFVPVMFTGSKTLTGGTLLGNDFSFELQGTSDNAANTHLSARNDSAGRINFGSVSYTQPGVYEYKVKEVGQDEAGIERSGVEHTVVVTVSDNEGELVASVTVDDTATGTAATGLDFTNTVLSGSATLSVSKAFDGTYEGSEKFTFNLERVGKLDGDTMSNPTEVSIAAGESASFGGIAFTKPGTYFYKITEVAGTSEDVEYNTEPRYAMVRVTRNTETDALPTLKTAVTYGVSPTEESCVESSLTIVNKVKSQQPDEPTTFPVRISKVDVVDSAEVEGAHIQILDKDGIAVVAEWDSTTQAHEVQLKAGEYTLRETVAPNGYAITSDTHFTVSEEGKATSSDTAISNDGVLLVEDARLTGKATLSVTKQVTSNVPTDGLDWLGTTSFNFALAAEGGTTVETKAAKAGETATFGELTFDRPGDYYYTITEAQPGNAVNNLTYDTAAKWAKVSVGVNAGNTALETSVTYGDSKDACDAADAATQLTVTNAYAVPALEKYVNKDVHQDLPAFDTPFTYDILAFIPKDAEKVVITDMLAKGSGISFLNGNDTEVVVEDIGPGNNHTAHGTVEQAKGTKVENAEVVIQGKELTVTVPDATANQGHWLRLTYRVKLDNAVVAGEGDYNESDENVVNNKTVISEKYQNGTEENPSHDGVATTASYVVYTAHDLQEGTEPTYSLEANDITVTPPTTNVPVSKVWLDADGNVEYWPEGVSVTVELLGNGKPLDEVTADIFGADKALERQTIVLTGDKQSGAFENVPVYDSIEYSVSETSVTGLPTGYTPSVSSAEDDQGVTSFVITNKQAANETSGTTEDKGAPATSANTNKATSKTIAKDTTTTTKGSSSTSPKTGDSLPILIVVAVVVVAAIVAGIAFWQRKRRD